MLRSKIKNERTTQKKASSILIFDFFTLRVTNAVRITAAMNKIACKKTDI